MTDILIPFASDCPHRQRALEYVTERYRETGYRVIVGVGDKDAWSKADAVADALTESDSTIIIVADADVWSDELRAAIAAVEQGAAWASPYNQVRRLNPDGTARFLAGDRTNLQLAERAHRPMRGGGIVVVPRPTYERIPLDPRFVGWGGEDLAWGLCLNRLAGPGTMTAGRCWHLWHPQSPRRDRIRGSLANTDLAVRYGDAQHDAAALSELIEEGRAWRSTRSSSPPSRSSIPR